MQKNIHLFSFSLLFLVFKIPYRNFTGRQAGIFFLTISQLVFKTLYPTRLRKSWKNIKSPGKVLEESCNIYCKKTNGRKVFAMQKKITVFNLIFKC